MGLINRLASATSVFEFSPHAIITGVVCLTRISFTVSLSVFRPKICGYCKPVITQANVSQCNFIKLIIKLFTLLLAHGIFCLGHAKRESIFSSAGKACIFFINLLTFMPKHFAGRACKRQSWQQQKADQNFHGVIPSCFYLYGMSVAHKAVMA